MKVVIGKHPFFKEFRQFFTLEFGLVDYDETLKLLCLGLRGDSSDYEHINDMVYRDYWLQGHHEPYTEVQQQRIHDFFIKIRAMILRTIQLDRRFQQSYRIHYVPTTSSMSLIFEFIE